MGGDVALARRVFPRRIAGQRRLRKKAKKSFGFYLS
jgi:hypothetical protein